MTNEILAEEREAIYSNKYKQLQYWTSHNATTFINCISVKQAQLIVQCSGIAQKLRLSNN